ncbi:ComEC/Rec2 family competence protein [Ruegeria meonggei]|uniref:ComEC/Rec2 family competence protein n=1 Tax=Ruegeria meonggei TaxID=1446476 RepID=UPI00366B29EC
MVGLDIRIWEVGAGLCIHIRTPNGQNHIIDAGKSDDFSPAEHIRDRHWSDGDVLNYLIISHQDADHVGDLENLKAYLGSPKIYLRNKSVPDKEKYGLLQRIYQQVLKQFDKSYTTSITWEESPRNPDLNGGVRIKYAFLDWSEAQTINNSSIVVAYEYQETVIIFPGDIEEFGWERLIAKNPNLFSELISDTSTVILVAPHHGRKSGYSPGMIDYFKPDLVIISDGYGAGETDPRFRTCASGLYIDDIEKKFLTTKTNGRKRISVAANGALYIDEMG